MNRRIHPRFAAAVSALWLFAGTSSAWAQDPTEPVPAPVPAEPATVPAEPVPAEPVPAEPVGAVPAEPVPAVPVPAEPAGAVPVASEPVPTDASGALPAPVETMPPYPEPPARPPRLLRYALSFEASTLANHDPVFDLFSRGDTMGGAGISAGVRLVPNLALVAGWQRVRRGSEVTISVPDDDADFQNNNQTLRAALLANELTLGLRADFGIARVLRPYVAGQAMLVTARVRLDDDPERRDNAGQVEAFGVAPGALVTFGAELRLPMAEALQPAVHLEMGPSWLLPANLDPLGEMQMGGFALRTGVGLRF